MRNLLFLFILLIICSSCADKSIDRLVLFDPEQDIAAQVKSNNNDEITCKAGNTFISFMPGTDYSTVCFYPGSGTWDASDYRFVRCEIENLSDKQQLVELGFGYYDLTLGGTLVKPGEKKILKTIIYRTNHPEYIDSVFPVMHGKPDGTLRGWMESTYNSIDYIKLLFPLAEKGDVIKVGQIWLEGEYALLSEDELKEKFYPFVDKFGQYMYTDWRDKIHSEEDLRANDEQENKDLDDHTGACNWNKYGGWEDGPQLAPTGRFRIEKYNGKWWFVDPEGKLFWSHGLDCVEYGIQSQTRIDGCEQYFSWLPEEGSDLYVNREWRGDRYKMLSFHKVNLERKYGENCEEVSHNKLHKRLRSWGMNTIGNWSDSEIYLMRRTPYVLTSYSMKTGLVADPYAEGFQDDLVRNLSARADEINDHWCLGVFIDNELKWGVKWGAKIAEQIQVAPQDQPAKLVLKDKLKDKYGTVEELNNSWGSSFSDWTAFLKNEDIFPGAEADMREFMKEFTTRYYASCHDAVKTVAPDLLYLGCRMDFHLYPEDTSLNYIIKIAADYCDVVSFNRYRYSCAELVPPDGGDYPIIIGEFHFGSLETGLLQPGLRYAADNDERAAFYEFYVTSALENPFIVGTHWFQLVDQAVSGRPDGENYQAGFLTVGDIPQREIIEKSRKVGYKMYVIRLGNRTIP